MKRKFKRCVLFILMAFAMVSLTGCMDYIESDVLDTLLNAGSEVSDSLDSFTTDIQDTTVTDEESTAVTTADGQVTVSFLDTGQSNATLIQTSSGENILIDTGDASSRDDLLNDLTNHGVSTINLLVITHWHLDHAGGATQVIQNFKVEKALVTDNVNSNVTTTKTLQALDDYGVETIVPNVGDTFTYGDCTFKVIGPVKDYTDQNQSSIVTRITHGNNAFLFPGDMEKDATDSLVASGQDLSCDVLHAPHHGSAYAVSDDFWNACGSYLQIVVVECGEGNSYGHPHQEVLDFCTSAGIPLYRTDQNGEVQIISDGDSVWVSSVEY